MWKWYSADESPPVPAGAASSQKSIGNQSVADLTEQLAQNEQLVLQLKELIREKDNQLQVKDQLLKEDKEAFEAKISKMKLQTKAKVTSLSAQLEDVKKQLGASSVKEQTTGKHKQSSDGDQEHAAANRGKILMLRKKVEELETQIVKKDTELKKTLTELEAQLQRGSNMDMMLAEKDKKLAEKEAYIIELQLAAVSNHGPQQVTLPSEEIEAVQHQLGGKETSSSDLQSMVHILTKKVEENEESFSLLQEQADNLKDQLNKEKIQYQEKEAMYMKNIRVFQEIIQAKENKLAEQAQKHEQELFIVASKLDASADFEQLLKALKQKLHEKEEVLMGRTQVVDVLQKELDGRDQKIQEIIEKLKLVQLEKDNLEAKLDAEKHVMRAQVRDLMERHEMDLKTMREKHSMQLRAIEEKHEDELAEKEQHQLKLLKQLQDLQAHGNASVILETTATIDKQKIGELEEQLKLKMEEVAKSEAKFLKMKAWSKSRIRQAEEDVRNAITGTSHQEQIILKNRVAELEEEKGNLEQKVNDLEKLRLQNEELLAKLELYEEQQQKMQADLEQMTKQATSQTSESGSAEELQSRLLEWREMVSESARGQAKEERAVMELRMTQIEEEREALVSGQQELEEELVQLRRLGQHQGREKCARDSQNLKVDYEYEKQYFEESSVSVDNADNTEGENLGGLWPKYTSHHTGLRTVVEELELERNRLQEQILMLEERYQDLEGKAQLRARIEFHQVTFGVCEEGQPLRVLHTESESERLQNQLSLVRSQQSRDFEQHQHLISNLNEQLKGVNDKKDFLENSLLAKETLLAESSAKLLQMDKLKESLEAQKIINQDLTGKLLQTEENLGNVNKKCSSFEIECVDLKNVVQDLSEKLSSNKEKVQKQEVAMEVLHQDLEQANDELVRLNSSHLEERACLIDDLQSCEREIDLLKETIAEKAHELTDLFKTVAEYSEHNKTLKEQNKCKEQEVGELRAALEKVEMEIMLLRKTQSVDDQTTNASISALVDQLSQIESELSNARSEDETKGKEIVSLLKQIGENNNTIQGLHSELQKQKQSAKAHLVDCSAQISLLENKIIIATQQLQETNAANQQEIESLKAQLIESSLAKGRLDRSLREKEEKEQCLENEMKTLKNQCNNLISDTVGKKEELTKLSKKFAEHKEEAEIRLQEKMDLVASLEKKLQAIQETNSQLVQEVQAKEIERQDLKNQIDEMTGSLDNLKKQTQELNETNGQLQATVKEQVQSLSEQAKLLSESNERVANHLEVEFNLEHQIKELSIKNENLKEIVNMKEDELFNKNDVIQQLEKGIASKEEQTLQYISTISQLQIDKESIVPKLELLKMLEQKEVTVEEQLREKIDECDFLKNQILENQKTTEQVRGQLQSLTVQLGELRLLLAEREDSLSNKITECISLQNQLHEGQETLMRLQDQIQDSNIELEVKDVALKQKLSECDGLQKTLSQQQLTAKSLESQVHALTEETEKLRQLLENRQSLLSNKSNECHVLQGQLDQKADIIVSLQKQMEALTVDKQCLQSESKELQLSLNKWTAEHNQLLIKANNCESVAAFAQDQAKILVIENQKLKENLENVNSTLCSKTDEVAALQALLSQKVGMVTSLNENVSTVDVGNGKFTLTLEGKQISSNRQAILLQQEQGKVLQEDRQMSQYVQIISHLQAQVQMITSEAAQFKQMLQEKESALQQKADLGGELEKITAEHEALKLQSMENMETILKLQNQIQATTSKTYELKCSIEERDKLLACKVDECVKVKAVLSETEGIISQLQEQLAAANTEVEQLRTTVQEKEMMVQQIKENTATCNEALMLKIQTKETEYSALNEKFNNLEHLFSQCNNQINQQNSEISQLKEVLVQKEASVLEERNLVRKWQDRANECDFLKLAFTESREKVSQLQNEVQNLLSESKQLEELLHEKETAFSHLQERYAAQSEQFEEFREMLRVKEQEITELQAALCTKDVNIQVIESNVSALMIEVKSLKEELQKSQVSLTDYRNVIQQKDEMFAINQRNMESQIVTLEEQKIQYKEAAERLDMINQDLKQNALILQKKYLDQTHHIEKLDSKLKASIEKSAEDYQEKAALIEHLYQQSDQLIKENSQLVHQIKVMKMEKEQTSVPYQQKANELQVLEEKLATMCDIREKLDISQRLKDETGSLQNQVSVKSEQIAKLKLEVQKLEEKLTESERKSLEFGRETEKNNLLTEKFSNLANQLELKDVKIDSLQKALDNLQEQLCEQSSVLKTSSSRLKEQEVLASKFSQQVVEKQSKLDELSALVLSTEPAVTELKQTLSEKEKEVESLQNSLSASEKRGSEITGSMGDKIKSFGEEKLSLCNELKQTELNHHLELEALQQVADLQKVQSQGVLREKQPLLDENIQQSNSAQEQISALEEELNKKSQQLEDAVKEGPQHFDSLQKKERAAHLLTMQVNQHQELEISLSQQLREKKASTAQLTESISKEMVTAAEEEKPLAGQIQELKVQHHVSNEKIDRLTDELAKYKKQLEEQEILLNAKETQYHGIAAENEQLLSQTEILAKERDLLKKKFQAALITRRDLMKKVQELQQGAIGKEKDQQITEMQHNYRMLESQTQELTSEVTISQKQIKQLESHVEVLKQQLVEKDSDINILSETLSKKETDLEQLEEKFNKCEMEQEALSVELLQTVQKKDSSIAELQAVLKDKAKTFEDERCQLISDLERIKSSLPKQTECSNTESPGRNEDPGYGNIGVMEIIEQVNVFKQEKEQLQKKLQAALLARKEAIKKLHEKDKHHKEQLSLQKEEYSHTSEMYFVQTKELENVKGELAALHQTHQTKLTEFECNRELTGTLQEQLQSVTVALNDKEKVLEQLKIQLEEQNSKMLAALSQQDEVQILEKKLTSMVSSLAVKDTDLKSLLTENDQLQQEKTKLISELGSAQVRIVETSEETRVIKHSLTSLECQYQEEKELKATEINWLQNQCRSIQAEAESLKVALEGALKDKENYSHTLENSAKDIACLKTQLLDLQGEKDQIQAQLDFFQGENAEVKSILQQASQYQKVHEEEKLHTQLLSAQSELAKMHESLQKRNDTIETLECTLSAKEKLLEELKLQVKKLLFYETEKERGKTSTIEVQQKAADNSEECRSKELTQRKLQAALISRKEALKENKALKHDVNALTSEKEVLISKISTLEISLVDVKKQLELLQQAISTHHEEKTMLLSEVDAIFAEKQNLNAAYESLKLTLEMVTEEKQDLSHQLDSLKYSQAPELSELKAKHDELKHEYESLLQSYENIGNEMDKMRQIVETTRKEKQEIVYKFREVEAKNQHIEKQLEEVSDHNDKMKDKMRKLAKSKQQRVQELEEEIERINTELQAISTNQSLTNELSVQYNQLREENNLLKQNYEELKSEFYKTQKENEHLLKKLNTSTSIFDELQSKETFHSSELRSKIDDKSQINESLSSGKQTLEAEDRTIQGVEQARQLLSEKLKQLKLYHKMESHEKEDVIIELQVVKGYQQEIVNLNEKVKILEDDKSLLQEELENAQEMSDKVKNEKEYLEAELLKNAEKLDQLTEALKTLNVQNNSLISELDSFRQEKCQLVKAKEDQEIKWVKEFEEKLRSAQRGKVRSNGETKQLQELLKEKQQEINQLQKDCIKYQELILDLERSVKASESACEELHNKLECATAKVSKSEEQIRIVQEELSSYKVLLRSAKSEADGIQAQCLELTEELQKKEEKAKAQITEKEKKFLVTLEQQKTLHQKEIVSYQDKLDLLERDKDRVVAELLEVQAEQNGRDLLIKKLQGELNSNLANLAAFAKCMSSLQDDRDRIIEESKKWETRFQDAIQNKEHQVRAKEEMLQKLDDEIKQKSFDVQELQHRSLKLEQTINELTVSSKDAEVKHQNELVNMKELICKHSEKLEEMERLLKEKEVALSKLLQENNDLSTQLSDMSHSVTKLKITEQMLEKSLAEKQSESRQLLSENEKLSADLEKQNAISQQLKLMLSNKDTEISKLISSKEGEISEYIVELQQQYKTHMEVSENKLKVFQHDSCKASSEVKELQMQVDKSREDKDKAIAKIDAFTKSMASLQDDRDRILSEYTQLEQRHLDMLSQKDGFIQESATENNELKQEIRSLLNQMDDLNSENAMLRAQLIQYREELNQVLSLKDNQLKELLQKQLQQIKNLEIEKSNIEKQWKEAQKSLEKCNESINSLQAENKQIMAQMIELKIAPLHTQDKSETNERKLILELQQKLKCITLEYDELKKDFDVKTTILEELENKCIDVDGLTKSETGFKVTEKAVEVVQERTQEKLVGSSNDLLKVAVCLKDQNLCNSNSEIKWLRNKIEELEKLLQAKLQEQTEQDISSFQNEMAELRSEKTLLLSESTATKEQYLLKVADHNRQFTELSKLNQEVWTSDLANINTVQQMKPLEIESSLSNENIAEQMKSLLIEKKQLQSEVQRYLQEIHHKEQKFQKLNSKVMQSIEEKATLSSQLKAVSQTLRDTQSRYGDLQDHYYRLERQYQTIRSSLHNEEQNETNEEVPPGAPQERASVIVEIDNLELSELRRRLAESDQRNDSAHQELSQLAEMLAQEELRRSAAEEALIAAEEMLKGLDIPTVRQPPREYTIQLESDEEREALIIDPSEHVVVRKVKRGALSFKRWLRGRSLYCSKIMSSRARSRYLVFVYFVTLHILVFMCLTGLL
ncbi:golgin subfamily B member 1-like isoform X3 [Chiloscyllium plagiosum]|uniref:golgin subfamily B member 1-like isoform X3 n=1 Tax=Chiloscyllium plagiosum TaxID=36176 RepID=UPI001CB8138A|nr:golgin subfamily B member 1-like isoform X3 [Chiloscyllium plagiosum]